MKQTGNHGKLVESSQQHGAMSVGGDCRKVTARLFSVSWYMNTSLLSAFLYQDTAKA